MQLHLVLEKGVEYNDEYHYFAEAGGGDPIHAFRDPAKALARCQELDKASRGKYEFEGGQPQDIYYVKPMDVDDADVETPESYDSARKSLEATKAKMKEAASNFFNEQAKSVFAAHPNLEAIRVAAYTPYFNDGDTCEYGINDGYIKFAGWENAGEGGFDYIYSRGEYPDGVKEAEKAASELIKSVTEDDFKTLFGDHVQVTITRDGVETEEYKHD